MAAEDDPRVTVEGDVELLMSLPLSLQQRSVPTDQQMQQHAGASPTYEGDDLVYSGGGGSGCWDDEDDCGDNDSPAGRKRDDLITPVYIPPTPRPQSRTSSPGGNNGMGAAGQPQGRSSAPPRHAQAGPETGCDDDEDCIDGGSGLGEVGGFTPHQNTPATPAFPTTPTTTTTPTTATRSGLDFAEPPRVYLPPPPLPDDHDMVHRIIITPPPTTTPYQPPLPPPRPPVYPAAPQQTPRPPPRGSRPPPVVYGVPIPDLEPPVPPPRGGDERLNPPRVRTSSAADSTAMVIGVIAGVLIVVVIVALVVYRVRSWTLAATPGAAAGGCKGGDAFAAYAATQPPQHVNGALKAGDAAKLKPPKKKDVKDLKEWYV